MHGFRSDVISALRVFRRSPGFAAVIAVTLGLGIGANSAIFSAVNGVLLQPLPFEEGEQLVRVRHGGVGAGVQPGNLSPLEIADYRERARTLTGIVEYHTMFFNLLEDGVEPERTQVGVVGWNYFDMLGVRPLHGRSFTPEEDAVGADPVLILGHAYWKRRFGGDPGVIGKVVQMNNRPHEIVGVLPPIPTYPNDNDVWMPWYACPFRAGDDWNLNRARRSLTTIARVEQGVTQQQLDADLSRVARELHHEHAATYPGIDSVDATAVPLKEELTAGAKPTFLVLIAMSGLVLLIACANVANLMLARMNGRQREMAVRTALGARRGQIVRHLLTESMGLALAGAVVAVGVAYVSVGALSAFASGLTPRFQEVRVDGWVLAFTALTAVATGLLVGGLPGAFPGALAERLRESKGSGGVAGQRVRSALVVSQVAVAFILLVGAGLMLRSLSNLLRVDPGYTSEDVLALTVDLDWARYTTPQDGREFFRALLERVRARPDVVAAGAASDYPMSGATFQSSAPVAAEGLEQGGGAPPPQLNTRFVTDGYFEALRLPVLRGRTFERADDAQAPLVAVVSAGAGRRLFGTQDPLGRRITVDGGTTWATVVGVVGDVRQAGLESDAAEEVYFPYDQAGFARQLLVRTAVPPMALARAITGEIYAIDANQAVSFVRTLDDAQSESADSPRTVTLLLSIFAAIALVTAAAGILSVISYSVSQRRREIGIRIALGAHRSRVVSMIVRTGLATVAIGLGLGVAGALLLTRMLEGMLYAVPPSDPLTLAAVAVILLAVAAGATFVPALRGTRVPPTEALRAEG